MTREQLIEKIIEEVNENLWNTNKWHQSIEVNDLEKILQKHLQQPTQIEVDDLIKKYTYVSWTGIRSSAS